MARAVRDHVIPIGGKRNPRANRDNYRDTLERTGSFTIPSQKDDLDRHLQWKRPVVSSHAYPLVGSRDYARRAMG